MVIVTFIGVWSKPFGETGSPPAPLQKGGEEKEEGSLKLSNETQQDLVLLGFAMAQPNLQLLKSRFFRREIRFLRKS